LGADEPGDGVFFDVGIQTESLGRYIAYLNIWKSASSVPQLATVLVIVTSITVLALPLTLAAHDSVGRALIIGLQ